MVAVLRFSSRMITTICLRMCTLVSISRPLHYASCVSCVDQERICLPGKLVELHTLMTVPLLDSLTCQRPLCKAIVCSYDCCCKVTCLLDQHCQSQYRSACMHKILIPIMICVYITIRTIRIYVTCATDVLT